MVDDAQHLAMIAGRVANNTPPSASLMSLSVNDWYTGKLHDARR